LKRGVDKKTLVEDNELFRFDKEVEPILSVLCGKTLEFARMEVLEEEELRVMQSQQHHFTDLNKTELSDAQRMEQMEQRKLQDFERRKALERERKKNKIAAHRKIVARNIAKGYMHSLTSSSYAYLKDVGYFVDNFKVDVLEGDVLPWLFGKVEELVEEIDVAVNFSDVLVGKNVDLEMKAHEDTVQAERDRRAAVQKAIEDAAAQKVEEKRKRKEARELQRKQASLRALKDELNARFVQKAEHKENLIGLEMMNINGFHQKQNVQGVIGGFLGQLIIVLSGAFKVAQKHKIEDFLTPNIVQNFLLNFIDQKMRTERFTMLVGKEIETFLNTLEKPLQLNEMRVMKEANYQKFRSLLSDVSIYGDEVLALLREQHELFGLPAEVYDVVYEGFWDLYCKKPD